MPTPPVHEAKVEVVDPIRTFWGVYIEGQGGYSHIGNLYKSKDEAIQSLRSYGDDYKTLLVKIEIPADAIDKATAV